MDNTFELRKILRLIAQNLFGVILIAVLSISSMLFSYFTAERTYLVKTLVEIDTETNNLLNTSRFLSSAGRINLPEQTRIYKSRQAMENVISLYDLDLMLDGQFLYKSQNKFFDDVDIRTPNKTALKITVMPKQNGYSIDGIEIDPSKVLKYNEEHSFPELLINIKRNPSLNYDDDVYTLTKVSNDKSIAYHSQFIALNDFPSRWGYGSLVEISHISSDIELSKNILFELNKSFKDYSVVKKSAQASASINFLNNELLKFSNLLVEKQNELNLFQSQNLFFEPTQEISSLINKLSDIEVQINEQNLEGIRLRGLYDIDSNIIQNLDEQSNFLEEERGIILEKISDLPEIEKTYINLSRDVTAYEQLVAALTERELDLSLSQASTISDVTVVDDPFYVDKVSPRASTYLAYFFLIGLIAAILYIIIRSVIFRRVELPSDITEKFSDITFLGVVPFVDDDADDTLSKNTLKTFASNVLLSLGDEKLILVTGAIKGVGKSFVARQLAETLSNVNDKSVLLIDADFYKGKLHEEFNVKRVKSEDYISTILNPLKIQNASKLYFAPKPTNASDLSYSLIDSQAFRSAINQVLNNYDFVIIDSSPIMQTTEASLLSTMCPVTINVASLRSTPWKDFCESHMRLTTISNSKQFFAINRFKKIRSYYGYYDYNYTYYGYDYAKD